MKTARNWRLVHLLGVSNLRARYSRSKLGQFWLTVSMFVQISVMGLVWSILWKLPIKQFVPYVAFGQVIYQFFSQIVLDSTTVFINDSRIYMNQKLPYFTSIFSSMYKNIIVLLHNLPILLLVFVWSGSHASLTLMMLPVFLLSLLFFIASTYVVACVCTRYRDVILIISTLLSISMFVTPVMWQMTFVPAHLRFYFYFNPFTCILELLRNPFISAPVDHMAYWFLLGWTLASLLSMIYTYHRFEKRIIFWI